MKNISLFGDVSISLKCYGKMFNHYNHFTHIIVATKSQKSITPSAPLIVVSNLA